MMAPNDENLEIVSAFADNSQLSPVTLQDESEEHRKQRLKNAVDGLLASYGKYPEIERIGTTPLPSKEGRKQKCIPAGGRQWRGRKTRPIPEECVPC